ncbi:glutathione hydrolase 1 proenzyme [Eurytemora carolleeae]|uniref:glutathione hydrolase 1 proenzyme n=1 Tax=Eurytemora carolleeae TaxID=1294199 RepID=UPI000C7575A0|nr:glutathione hydrolase 1 proenzyme [Eurytemora carolleeae]|eukprot:XP_023326865.1 glutathione hydrolase 1 proenzyme-like [Eurytemora affinis]
MLELLLCALVQKVFSNSSSHEYQAEQIKETMDEDEDDENDLYDVNETKSILNGRFQRRRFGWIHVCFVFAFLCAVGAIFLFSFFPWNSSSFQSQAFRPSILGNFSKAAVAVDGEPCAKVGKDVLVEGGSAVDAAIATLFCNGVYNSQSMGLGGGFLMTIFEAKKKEVFALDAREKAPGAATQDMFNGDADASQRGPLSIAVPGEISGYWEAKKRFGCTCMSWARLVEPTINMCRNGITVSWTHANTLADNELTDPKMREIFINPKTGEAWKEGDVYYRHDFADTLEKLAQAGDAGEERLGIYELGGIITEEDLKDYNADWVEPVKVHLSNTDVDFYSVPPPGSGAILAYILNILDEFNISAADPAPLLAHRITESFKWAYALRTELGDPSDPEITEFIQQIVKNMTSEESAVDKASRIEDDKTYNNASHYGAVFYTPEDHGTAHVSILAENGDAVSVTSTINLYFGSLIMSKRTGIILNDEMDDFSAPNITNYFGVPPSPHNFIKGGKRPLSSMSPAVIVNKDGKVRLVVGAAGGTKITTATALTIISNLWLGEDIKMSIDKRRIHHQLAPMEVSYEPDYPQDLLKELEKRGHATAEMDSFGSVINGVSVEKDGRIYANADFRKAGGVDGY